MFRWLIILLFIGLPLGAAGLAWQMLSEQPAVTELVELSHQDIARAKQILRENDPRHLRPGSRRQVVISQQELALALHYLAQTFAGTHTRVRLSAGRADLTATRQLPLLPRRAYLNVAIELRETDGTAEIAGIRIGRIGVPSWLAQWLLQLAIDTNTSERQGQLLRAALQDLRLRPGSVELTYVWNPALIAELGSLISVKEQAAINAYQAELTELSHTRPRQLDEILKPLFHLARQRSTVNDPAVENRALLAVLGAWAVGKRIPIVEQQPQNRPTSLSTRLRGRRDLAQHYLASAALAATGDSLLADAIGVYKEVADSSERSGFSFSDLAADLAGSKLGKLATASPQSAIEIQARLSAGVSDSDLLPEVDDLPDNLSQSEFQRRFERIDSPAYRQIVGDIEQRINRHPLYRRPG